MRPLGGNVYVGVGSSAVGTVDPGPICAAGVVIVGLGFALI